MVTAPPLEDLITDAVLYRLDSPELAAALAGRSSEDERTNALADELAGDRAQLDELARLYADKAVTANEWIIARNTVEARITNAQRSIARATRTDALAGLDGNGEHLRTQWARLPLSRQHAIIAAVLDHAIIDPGNPSVSVFDPQRVRPLWRL